MAFPAAPVLWGALELAWIAVVAVWQVDRRRPPAITVAWILALSLLPLAGLPLYFFFGPPRLERRRRRYLRLAPARALAAPDPSTLGLPERALCVAREVGGTRLPRLIRPRPEEADRSLFATPLLPAASLTPFRDGKGLYRSLCADLEAATDHIHLEYYIWEPDEIGSRLRDLLVGRALSGVKVRIIHDALGSSALKRAFFRSLESAGGEVVPFNPPRSAGGRRMNLRPISKIYIRSRLMNFRTHRKLAVIDGRVGYTGGMNVSRVHTSEFSGAAAWRDTHLRLTGQAVAGLQETFLQQWNYIHKTTLPVAGLFPAAEGGCAAPAQFVRSGPLGAGQPIRDALVAALYAARSHVFITTAYLIPDETLLAALRAATARGVDVRLLVPVQGDSRLVTAAARSYHADLLETGLRLYEFGPPMLHAKTAVIDDWLALVGSCNLDPRSFKLNFEVVAAVYDAGLARTLTEWFSEDLANAREVTSEALAARDRNPLRRLAISAARVVSPLL